MIGKVVDRMHWVHHDRHHLLLVFHYWDLVLARLGSVSFQSVGHHHLGSATVIVATAAGTGHHDRAHYRCRHHHIPGHSEAASARDAASDRPCGTVKDATTAIGLDDGNHLHCSVGSSRAISAIAIVNCCFISCSNAALLV